MNKARKTSFRTLETQDYYLLDKVHLLLEEELEDPDVEAEARKVLATLRARGFELQDADLDCEDCLACLHMALCSALDARPVVQLSAVRH